MNDVTAHTSIARMHVRQVEEAGEQVAEDAARERVAVEQRSVLDSISEDLFLAVKAMLRVTVVLVHHRAGNEPRLVVQKLAGIA